MCSGAGPAARRHRDRHGLVSTVRSPLFLASAIIGLGAAVGAAAAPSLGAGTHSPRAGGPPPLGRASPSWTSSIAMKSDDMLPPRRVMAWLDMKDYRQDCTQSELDQQLGELRHRSSLWAATGKFLPADTGNAVALKTDDVERQNSRTPNGTLPGNGSHLKYMGVYDFEPPQQAGWTNLGLTFYHGWPTPNDTGLPGQLAAWGRYKIPSLYYMEITGAQAKIWQPGVGLLPGWEAHVEAEVAKFRPHFGAGKAVRGVALGDEMCCRNVTCWEQYVPYTQKLRALLGKQAILYTNECWLGPKPAGGMGQVTIAPEFDLFSVDTYQCFLLIRRTPRSTPYPTLFPHATLFPLMLPHQQALIVAGTFGCSNLSTIGQTDPVRADGADSQTKNVLAKLDGLFVSG
eukprot:SAG22_NODE_3425_length_1719_cov_1.348148_1_plen_401_part_00